MKIHRYLHSKIKIFFLSWNTFLTFWTKINLLCDTLKKIFFSTNLAEQHQKTTFFLALLEVHSFQFQRVCSMKFREKYFKNLAYLLFHVPLYEKPNVGFSIFHLMMANLGWVLKKQVLILKNLVTQAGQVLGFKNSTKMAVLLWKKHFTRTFHWAQIQNFRGLSSSPN